MNTIVVPEIYLPKSADMRFWAVNACDQFTSDAEYWREVERLTRGKPSAYNLIFPEIYLSDEPEKRIASVNATMRAYLSGGVFKSEKGLVLVERGTASGVRTGVVLAVDLEDYSFEKGSRALIRSTEATILERIPPRVKIRENAPLELPHIMLLYEDKKNTVLNCVKRGKTLYDFDLIMNGGRVKGTQISNPDEVIEAFYSLIKGEDDKLLFAVGDGNHSLATAKTCWENIKRTLSEDERKTHPARYALAEAVNIYDPALKFEPIHRLIKTENAEKFIKNYKTSGSAKAYIVLGGVKREIPFNADIPSGIRELDDSIKTFLNEYGGEVDYIHGENELIGFTANGNAGVLLPAISKDDFFSSIKSGGNLPKKTFSMGEGNEKRYYIEAKAIR